MKHAIVAVVLCVATGATARAGERELRGVWIPNTDTAFFDSRASIAAGVEELARGGINVLFPVVWSKGATLYPSAVMRGITGEEIDPRYAGRDPLAEVIFEAHRRGVEVIPWFEYGFCAGHERFPGKLLTVRPEWAAIGIDGRPVVKNGFLWMNALDPAVQSWMSDLVLEVCRDYDVDGVQGDDRLPAMPCEAGYDAATSAAWKAKTRKDPPKDPRDAAWTQWRAERLTDYLEELRDAVKRVDPELVFSMAPGAPGWAYREYLQQQDRWMERGLIDALHPQAYERNASGYERQIDAILDFKWIAKQRDKLFPGVLSRVADWRATPELLAHAIRTNRAAKLDGEVFFFHQGLLDDGGLQLKALAKGPYAKSATPPWRKGDDWRPGSDPIAPTRVATAGSAAGSAAGDSAAGEIVRYEWKLQVSVDGAHRLHVWSPEVDGVSGPLTVRIATSNASTPPVVLTVPAVPAVPADPASRPGAWVDWGLVTLAAGRKYTVQIDLAADAGSKRIGELVALVDRRAGRKP